MFEISNVTDQKLIEKLKDTVKTERKTQGEFLRYLCEVDNRRLYLKEGYSSLHRFCTQALGFSDASAWKRIQVARASKRFPVILEMVGGGSLTLSNVSILSPHLSNENASRLLKEAQGKNRLEVEKMIVAVHPKPDTDDSIRRLPVKLDAELAMTQVGPVESLTNTAPPTTQVIGVSPNLRRSSNEKVEPLSPTRTQLKFSVGEEFLSKLDRAKSLVRHKYPSARLEDIFGDALECLLLKKDPSLAKPGLNAAPATHSRYIPRSVRSEVWRRDNGMCTYVSPAGKKCGETAFLQLDHVEPFALGGSSTDPTNIQLLCAGHNRLRAQETFGQEIIGQETFGKRVWETRHC